MQSQEDLESAEATLEIGRYYVSSLLAQQAAEKALKALFIQRKRSLPPRTHYLEELGTGSRDAGSTTGGIAKPYAGLFLQSVSRRA
ncbi:MAG: HEPN domain-containing protein [Chloroflexi bacterium]|nr:HEPN domain-containing protein [Chloroflexota bacterium]